MNEQNISDQIDGGLHHQKEEYEMIEEYRKVSAEWIGWHIEDVSGRKYYTTGKDEDGIRKIWIRIEAWIPDKSYSQMGMIEDKFVHDIYFSREDGMWLVELMDENLVEWIGKDKSKPIAFMKAFMEYIGS